MQDKKVRDFHLHPIIFFSPPIIPTTLDEDAIQNTLVAAGGPSMSPEPFEPEYIADSLAESDAHPLRTRLKLGLTQIVASRLGRAFPKKRKDPACDCSEE